jgi:hypothetical protein
MPYTLSEVALHFERAAARCEAELSAVVHTVVTRAGIMARGYIGHDQVEWEPLSSATVNGFRHERGFWVVGKEALGYGGAESPLFRQGDLVNSIDTEVNGLEGYVGSDSKIALYQEMGTPGARYPIPPRPIFAKAMAEATQPEELELLAEEVLQTLMVPG